MRSTAFTLFVAVALASIATAQSFNYPDFLSTNGLALNGNAAPSGTVMRVTPATANQVGAVWYSTPVAVHDGFDTTFTFQITQVVNAGADGLVFVVHNDPRGTAAMGSLGYAMGYGGGGGYAIQDSLAIEIDTWFNTGDFGDNEVSVQCAGMGVNGTEAFYSLAAVPPTTIMSDGLVHTMRVTYVPGTVTVYLDNLSVPILNASWDFDLGTTWSNGTQCPPMNLIGGSGAYVGFTSGTGGAWENHDVLSWSFTSTSGGTPYCTAGTTTHGCTASISGSGVPSASAASGFTLSIANVEGQKQGLIFYGVDNTGFAPLAWGTSSSFLCVKSPLQRTLAQNSGGTANLCDGALSIDWNAFVATTPGCLGTPFSAGDHVYAQGWFRDPPSAKTTMLSDALDFVVQP
jgi:hypothetical protein